MQAYLEAEPATRTTKDEYVMRYQHFAKSGLEQALKKYTALHDNIGTPALLFSGMPCNAHVHPMPRTMPHHNCQPVVTVIIDKYTVGSSSGMLSMGARLFQAESLQYAKDVTCRAKALLLCCTGDSEMKALKRQDVNFALVVADSLLARDKLDRALRTGQERLREKQASGLKREDLIFCDD